MEGDRLEKKITSAWSEEQFQKLLEIKRKLRKKEELLENVVEVRSLDSNINVEPNTYRDENFKQKRKRRKKKKKYDQSGQKME
jgi:hypothetical protein